MEWLTVLVFGVADPGVQLAIGPLVLIPLAVGGTILALFSGAQIKDAVDAVRDEGRLPGEVTDGAGLPFVIQIGIGLGLVVVAATIVRRGFK